MLDIKLNASGDIDFTNTGDIILTDSVRQSVLVRLRWILNEWRFNPEIGFPWFEDVLVKNPNNLIVSARIRDAVMSVDGVTGCSVKEIYVDPKTRKAIIQFDYTVGEELYREEVELNG